MEIGEENIVRAQKIMQLDFVIFPERTSGTQKFPSVWLLTMLRQLCNLLTWNKVESLRARRKDPKAFWEWLVC